MATPQFLTKNPNFLHEAFLDIYTADPRWLRLSDNFYENHDRLMNSLIISLSTFIQSAIDHKKQDCGGV